MPYVVRLMGGRGAHVEKVNGCLANCTCAHTLFSLAWLEGSDFDRKHITFRCRPCAFRPHPALCSRASQAKAIRHNVKRCSECIHVPASLGHVSLASCSKHYEMKAKCRTRNDSLPRQPGHAQLTSIPRPRNRIAILGSQACLRRMGRCRYAAGLQ